MGFVTVMTRQRNNIKFRLVNNFIKRDNQNKDIDKITGTVLEIQKQIDHILHEHELRQNSKSVSEINKNNFSTRIVEMLKIKHLLFCG